MGWTGNAFILSLFFIRLSVINKSPTIVIKNYLVWSQQGLIRLDILCFPCCAVLVSSYYLYKTKQTLVSWNIEYLWYDAQVNNYLPKWKWMISIPDRRGEQLFKYTPNTWKDRPVPFRSGSTNSMSLYAFWSYWCLYFINHIIINEGSYGFERNGLKCKILKVGKCPCVN